jgi:hypothetical protein
MTGMVLRFIGASLLVVAVFIIAFVILYFILNKINYLDSTDEYEMDQYELEK